MSRQAQPPLLQPRRLTRLRAPLPRRLQGCRLLSTHDDFRCGRLPASPRSPRPPRRTNHQILNPLPAAPSPPRRSIAETFPGRARIVTTIRDPVDRILSAYEFAVEARVGRALGGGCHFSTRLPPQVRGLRFEHSEELPLPLPGKQVAARTYLNPPHERRRPPAKTETKKARSHVSTPSSAPASRLRSARLPPLTTSPRVRARVRVRRQVWPWSVLVPLMEADLQRRHAAAQRGGGAEPGSAYANGLVMPLAEFARHPAVREVLGDGATMQLLVRLGVFVSSPAAVRVTGTRALIDSWGDRERGGAGGVGAWSGG